MAEIVGRDAELRTISSWLDSRDARALVIEGEPGIGKTTLWQEAVRMARDRGVLTLSATASVAESRFAFAAIADLFEPHVESVLPTLPTPQARALAIALRREDAPQDAPLDPATLAFAILAGLRRLAADTPVTVALDDVQWLDEPSASALAFALRRLGDDDVRFVLARRTYGETALPLGLDRRPGEHALQIVLGPLSLGAVSAVVTDRLGAALPRPVLTRVHGTANGNPFYAVELARALRAAGGRVAPGEPLPVPTSLDELLTARLTALPAETRAALLAVAALREPTVELVADAVGTGDLAEALAPAVADHVIEVDREAVGFVHPLLAAAVYSHADRDARRETHLALAHLAPTAEERARHLALGSEPPDEEVARELDSAAQAAASRGSPASAADLAELAARFTAGQDADDERRRLCDAADFSLLAGDMRRAYSLAAPLVESAPEGLLRARALFVTGFAEGDWQTDGRSDALERALVEAAGAHELEARIHHFFVLVSLSMRTVEEAGAHAKRALALSAPPLSRAQSTGLVILTELVSGALPAEDGLDAACEVEAASQRSLHYGPLLVRALRQTFADRHEDARAAFEAAQRRAAEHGDEVTIAACLLHRTELECRSGHFAAAAEYAREGYELTQQLGAPVRVAILAYAQALAHAFLGDVEGTRAKAAEALVAPRYYETRARSILGQLALALGDVETAAEVLRPLPDRLLEMGYGEPTHIDAFPAAIESLALIGEHDEAARLLALYEQRATRGPFGRAVAARSRGVLAHARGDLDLAFGAFEESLREHAATDTPFEHARTLLALGRVQRRARRRRAARETLEAARASFEALGARLWSERATEELGRIGGRAPSAGELTPTEQRVALLVAEGRSNKQVAATLVLSVHTVEAALTSIYRKLGIHSRVELARQLANDSKD